jgi:3-isopropylmalate/(R)-2-methylmalate dehydratase small subunit
MVAIKTISGTVLPYMRDNVDTDQILPKQFLTRITREGYGDYLFNDLRYQGGDKTRPDDTFVLNLPHYKGANILLAGKNFGCGSSREHAPWAISDYGFRAIIASSFADIFYSNCINNQIVPIVLEPATIEKIHTTIQKQPRTSVHINLTTQCVNFLDSSCHFDIANNHKTNLIKGLDKIDGLLDFAETVRAYEAKIPIWRR